MIKNWLGVRNIPFCDTSMALRNNERLKTEALEISSSLNHGCYVLCGAAASILSPGSES